MLRPLFFTLLALALIGDARVFFFVANRIVFGSHLEEKPKWHWLLRAVPPLLLVLTLLFWPLDRWLRDEDFLNPRLLPAIGAAWLVIAASIGTYWIIDRARMLIQRDQPVAGTRTLPSKVIKLRKAHVPFAALRNLGAHNDVYDLEVTRHEVAIENLPPSFDGYRIAFLTDTHVASFMRRGFYREAVAQVMQFDPDLVLFGGDFVSWEKHIPLMAEVLFGDGELRARDGIYAILGNHDYWANADGVIAALTARGARVITNRSLEIARAVDRGGHRVSERIVLAGIDEVYRGHPDIDAALARTDPSIPCIVISHHPDIVDLLEKRPQRNIDLLLCGHTHGGQIRFPFFGSVVVPSRHEARYAAGFHRLDTLLLYVSRGLGAIPPLRILCKPEVATFTLRRSLDDHETVGGVANDRARRA